MRYLLVGVCSAAFAWTAVAHAQSGQAPSTAPSRGAAAAQAGQPGAVGDPAAETTPTTPAINAPANTVGEVIVTAQRRAERLQDVPLSITAVSGAQLAKLGVASTEDLTDVAPGLKMDRNGVNIQPAIRGVSSVEADIGADTNVAIYLDGVYQPNLPANAFDLPDVSRVEVDKGPQGTLFGRNAEGGAIQVFTLNPSFAPTGSATVGYGTYNDLVAKGFVSAPLLGDMLAGSLSAFYESSGGYLKDETRGGRDFGGVNNHLVRGKLLFKPIPKLTALLSVTYSDRTDAGDLGQAYNGNSYDAGVRTLSAPTLGTAGSLPGYTLTPGANANYQTVTSFTPTAGALNPTGAYQISNNGPSIHNVNFSPNIKIDYDAGLGTFTSTSSYQHLRERELVEGDYTGVNSDFYDTDQTEDTITEDLLFSSRKIGKLSFVVGGFYYYDHSSYVPLRIDSFGDDYFDIYADAKDDSFALFGEANYELTNRITLIAGVRYSHEHKTLEGNDVYDGSQLPAVFARHTWTGTTPRFSIRYRVDPQTNAYFTYSEGFKSGGFPTSALVTIPYAQEHLDAYEVGVKTQRFDKLTLNAAFYYYDFTNQQVQSVIVVDGAQLGTTTNAASSTIYGLDLDATYRPTHELTFSAGLSALHTRYDSFPAAAVDLPYVYAPGTPLAGQVCNCGNQALLINATGNNLIRSPDWTLSVTADYTKELRAGTVDATATVYHSDTFYFTPDNHIGQPAYTTLGVNLSFAPRGTPWRVSVYGKNLTDQVILSGASILPNVDGVYFAPPRTYGIQVQYSY